jgi:hypothetical protein
MGKESVMRSTSAVTSILGSTLALLLTATPELAAAKAHGGPYDPHIEPANFVTGVDNPYFPLVPGTTFKLVEKLGKHVSENTLAVTSETKVVMGVTCVVVRDQVTEKGVLKEDTRDWYAQDKDGNVWYFGEDTKEFLDHGKVSAEGSWEAGVNGAFPGIMMKGDPVPGEPFRQEYGKGVAEDMGQIVAVNESVTVPFGTFTGCVRTKEWSLLEAGTEKKWYAKGIGVVRTESTEKEVAELVSVTRP